MKAPIVSYINLHTKKDDFAQFATEYRKMQAMLLDVFVYNLYYKYSCIHADSDPAPFQI